MLAALTLTPCLDGQPASIGCERCLVVLLRFSDDDGKENLLLPHGRLTGAIKPRIGGLPRTSKGGNDHGSRIRGERFSEGHGRILPQKKKHAMQKINLDKRPQCRQSLRMSNTNQLAQLATEYSKGIRAYYANNTFGGTSIEAAVSYATQDWLNQVRGWSIEEAAKKLASMPLFIEEQAGLTMSDIRIRSERLAERAQKAGQRLDVIVIDHLGLIRPSSRYSGSRVNEIGEITASSKSLARELDIGVVLLSQLSRGIESRDDKRPMLSDLRDSGAIEQDADMIAFVYRDHYYLERMKKENDMEHETMVHESRNKMEFIIAKQRNGPLGTVNLFADMSCSAVRNGER